MNPLVLTSVKSLTGRLWLLAVTLLLLTLWMSYVTWNSLRVQLMDSIVDQANVVADNIAPALQFEDREASDAILASLAGNRAIVGAMLIDNQHELKALWNHTQDDITQWLSQGSLDIPPAWQERMIVYPIQVDRTVQGQLIVLVTHQYLNKRVYTNLFMTLAAIALVLLVAYVLLRRADQVLIRKEQDLYRQAHYDGLTGLPNRLDLIQTLQQRIERQQPFRLIFIDIDHFKQVNDGHGHAVGDLLLQTLVKRWQPLLSDGLQLFRQGNDEFILVIDQDCPMTVDDIAELLFHFHKMPLLVDNHEFFLSLTMGSCAYPKDSTQLMELMQHLDIALHVGKATRRGKLTHFSQDMLTAQLAKLTLLKALQHALEREELLLYFQPQVALSTGKIVGVEALVRWQQQDGRLVPPNDFIPLAEETGLIVPIGSWVLREACRVRKIWLDQGVTDLVMAVNLSARQFMEEDLPSLLESLLTEYDLPAHLLVLEVTESLFMNNLNKVLGDLSSMKAQGVAVAIDDFGTGYSSMAYLQQLPIDYLKIDRSFIMDLDVNERDKALVKTMIQLAQNLSLKVVAEGIEKAEQAEYLLSLGCHKGQGYYFGKPMTAAKLLEVLAKPNNTPNSF